MRKTEFSVLMSLLLIFTIIFIAFDQLLEPEDPLNYYGSLASIVGLLVTLFIFLITASKWLAARTRKMTSTKLPDDLKGEIDSIRANFERAYPAIVIEFEPANDLKHSVSHVFNRKVRVRDVPNLKIPSLISEGKNNCLHYLTENHCLLLEGDHGDGKSVVAYQLAYAWQKIGKEHNISRFVVWMDVAWRIRGFTRFWKHLISALDAANRLASGAVQVLLVIDRLETGSFSQQELENLHERASATIKIVMVRTTTKVLQQRDARQFPEGRDTLPVLFGNAQRILKWSDLKSSVADWIRDLLIVPEKLVIAEEALADFPPPWPSQRDEIQDFVGQKAGESSQVWQFIFLITGGVQAVLGRFDALKDDERRAVLLLVCLEYMLSRQCGIAHEKIAELYDTCKIARMRDLPLERLHKILDDLARGDIIYRARSANVIAREDTKKSENFWQAMHWTQATTLLNIVGLNEENYPRFTLVIQKRLKQLSARELPDVQPILSYLSSKQRISLLVALRPAFEGISIDQLDVVSQFLVLVPQRERRVLIDDCVAAALQILLRSIPVHRLIFAAQFIACFTGKQQGLLLSDDVIENYRGKVQELFESHFVDAVRFCKALDPIHQERLLTYQMLEQIFFQSEQPPTTPECKDLFATLPDSIQMPILVDFFRFFMGVEEYRQNKDFLMWMAGTYPNAAIEYAKSFCKGHEIPIVIQRNLQYSSGYTYKPDNETTNRMCFVRELLKKVSHNANSDEREEIEELRVELQQQGLFLRSFYAIMEQITNHAKNLHLPIFLEDAIRSSWQLRKTVEKSISHCIRPIGFPKWWLNPQTFLNSLLAVIHWAHKDLRESMKANHLISQTIDDQARKEFNGLEQLQRKVKAILSPL
ncbi:MAG: hypothetical protein ACE5OZ_18440 [Candidatus Heimdallarchaeota archaeon]